VVSAPPLTSEPIPAASLEMGLTAPAHTRRERLEELETGMQIELGEGDESMGGE
jgi:hypothetical protein